MLIGLSMLAKLRHLVMVLSCARCARLAPKKWRQRMTHTLTALFEDHAEAVNTKETLMSIGVPTDQVHIIDQKTPDYNQERYSDMEDSGIWATIKDMILPDEDRRQYEEGVRRGGFLLTARTEDLITDDAINILGAADTVDMDKQAELWRFDGWDYSPPAVQEQGASIQHAHNPLKMGKRDIKRSSVKVRSYMIDR